MVLEAKTKDGNWIEITEIRGTDNELYALWVFLSAFNLSPELFSKLFSKQEVD